MQTEELRAQYLDLLKKTLVDYLHPDPLLPYRYHRARPWFRRLLIHPVLAGLRAFGLGIHREVAWREADIVSGERSTRNALSLIGFKRMENIQSCLETCFKEGVAGDFIETGVWRGGACIFARGVCRVHGEESRTVWVADSFAGLPPPDPRYPSDRRDVHYLQSHLCVSLAEVRRNFERFGLLDDRVRFLPGWFKDTLPSAPFEQLCVARLDGDMYGSTWDALQQLYPKLSRGGFLIVDDYALQGCRKAVEDYRAAHRIREPLRAIDAEAVFWRKES
jgi:O-methyltransferase